MRANRLLLSVAVITSAGLSACGSITNSGTQLVDVVVKGSPRAACTFETSKFRNFGQFPNKLTVERSKENLKADCQGEQNRHTAFEVPSRVTAKGTFGNAFNGFLPGMAYDSATGGLYEYPNPIIVDFREIGEGPKPVWPDAAAVATTDAKVDQTRIGTASIATPMPIRMQPIMDDQLNPAVPATRVEAQSKTEVVDAVRLAVDNPQPVAKVTTVTTKTTTEAAAAGKMKPVTSPEDQMGQDPAKVKAQEAAKKKAKEDAARKAKDAAAAKKRAAEEAKKAAEQPAQQPAALPETTATPPAESMPAAQPTPTTMGPATLSPSSDATTTPPATTTTTTTTTTTPPADATPTPAQPAPITTTTTTTTIPTTTPAGGAAPKDDMDKYLEGGQ